METPLETVERFCAAWSDLDIATIGDFFTNDAIYHNIPMEPVHGRSAIVGTIEGFTTGAEAIEFEIVNAAANGAVVMNERIDRFTWPDGTSASIAVMGTFEIVDGRIAAWRDYFDLQQFMVQTPR